MAKVTTTLFCVTLALILGIGQGTEFIFQNNLGEEVWVGTQGNDGKEPLEGGGFKLGPGQEHKINSPDDWAGRFWPRTGCNPDTNHCETGDCGNRLQCGGNGGNPPCTLAEITLKGDQGQDFYDISNVDGFNTKLVMEPINGQQDGTQYRCKPAACTADINAKCPPELKQGDVACKSACTAFNTDQYCCRGAHDKPETCKSTDWPQNYPAFFKENCPDAYSYAYDDHKSTFTCQAQTYKITFG